MPRCGSLIGVLWVAVGCASMAGRHQPLPPAHATCQVEGLASAQLRARVFDTRGDGLPGIPVKATQQDAPSTEAPFTTSKGVASDGWVVLEMPGNHSYKIVVEYPGFVPRSGIIYLAAGCRTEMSLELKIKKPDEIIE